MALLEVKNLKVYFKLREGWVRAVDDVSFELDSGETLGLVGESGCGKSTAAFAITQLLPPNGYIKGGKIIFKGKEILAPSVKKDGDIDRFNPLFRKMRWDEISMIFQGAMESLNPVHRVSDQLAEAILAHKKITKKEAVEQVKNLYSLVGIPEDRIRDYPHQFSGGMKQRALIAMALALNPSLIIADEPTTALDVLVQDKIFGEMEILQKKYNIAMIIITHDISIVAEMAHKVAVMYAGKLVETGKTTHIFKTTSHPYTLALLRGFPSLKGEKKVLEALPGNPPDLLNPPEGCRFYRRCKYATENCKLKYPEFVEVESSHYVACHRGTEIFGEVYRR